MRARRWMAAAVAAGVASACDPTFFLLPVEPDDVSIELAVTGGLAGASYSFVVDGAEGEVRGLTCGALCDFGPGEVLAVVSMDQVAALAAALDETGIMEIGDREYGDGCCDFHHLVLTYARDGETVVVEGTQDRFPPDLSEVVALLYALGEGRIPAIVSPDTDPEDWPVDAYTLGEVSLDALTLTAELSYGGGCAAHPVDLVLWGGWMESFPVQVRALITHDDGDDPCDAIVNRTQAFDLRPLVRAYEASYGRIGETRPTVVLQLFDPVSGSPLGRMIEVEL